MDSIFLQDYRCFYHRQEARMAPLTLLVGGNSTGKTSFMALIRVLWDIAYGFRIPDFKEEPYDLGSFDEIAHHRGAKGGRTESFEAGFLVGARNEEFPPGKYGFTFGKSGATPVPVKRHISRGKSWLEEIFDSKGNPCVVRVGTSKGSWEKKESINRVVFRTEERLVPPYFLFSAHRSENIQDEILKYKPLGDSPAIGESDIRDLFALTRGHIGFGHQRPFASAPVRSKPRRTYDPSRSTADPEGDHIPMLLANLFLHDRANWKSLKCWLEEFGRASGLFDEISVKPLGKRDSEPFQLQVRKFGGRLKGPHRNLSDVGYGVSQVLPVITELLRNDSPPPPIFLLQQPEVHLHPSAQASLGSLFCQVAQSGRNLVVETHSDYLIDRVRMDVRDGKTQLRPEEVSILFFEHDALDVNIHSLQIDSEGNFRGTPPGYRKFFMEETRRSLGL